MWDRGISVGVANLGQVGVGGRGSREEGKLYSCDAAQIWMRESVQPGRGARKHLRVCPATRGRTVRSGVGDGDGFRGDGT